MATPALAASSLPAGGSTLLLLGLAVALGGGLLIGLERERRKGEGPGRRAAGIRSFALVALGGGVAQALGQPALVALGAAAVLVLAGLAYYFDRRAAQAGLRLTPMAGPAPSMPSPGPAATTRRRPRSHTATPAPTSATTSANTSAPAPTPASTPAPADPGMTTELALFVTYLVGVLSMARPALGAACAVAVAVLLAARGRLHRFATRLLSEQELHDGLLLAALGLVLLPLVPQQPVAWLAGLQPSVLAGLVLLILLLQAAGHLALRWAGPGVGLPLSGLMSGFVSSTATVAAMGSRARATPAWAGPCTAAAVLSTAATWLQAAVMLWALAPALARALLPTLVAGAAVALALGAWLARRSAQAPAAGTAAAPAGSALQVRQALLVAAALGGVTVLVTLAERWFGQAGALAGAALAGLADAHAGVVAVGTLAAQDRLSLPLATAGVLAAIGANGLSRTVVAALSGGRRYAAWVALGLGAALAAAAGVAAWTGGLGGVSAIR